MIETDIPIIGHRVSELIHEIDTRYASNSLDGIDDLEECLEEHFEDLEAALCEIEDESECAPDLEPDPGEGCSIEAQFREAYAQHIFSRWNLSHFAELVDHLRSVLIGAQRGGMTPAGFRGAADSELVELARELFWEQRQRIARLLSSTLSVRYAS